jgi:hypothetical protein
MLLFAPEGVGLVLLALWLYCIFDCITTDESLARNLPKGFWVMIVLFLPDVGSIAWLLAGRPTNAGWRPGDTTPRSVQRARGPEDSTAWRPPSSSAVAPADRAQLEAWEADLARRERELGARRGQPVEPDERPTEPRDPKDDEGPGFTYRW